MGSGSHRRPRSPQVELGAGGFGAGDVDDMGGGEALP